MHHRARDLTGLSVGYLTARHYAGSDGRRSLWQVDCACGNTIRMQASEFLALTRRGIKAPCGCRRKESIGEKNKKHGMSYHAAYAVYRSMLDRCRLPTHQAWANYGGRGIKVCARWQESFANFWADMGNTYEKGLTIDRIDNNGNYEKDNCRWVSAKRQARNKRSNIIINTPWGRMTAAEAADRAGVNRTTVYYRLSVGMPDSLVLLAPGALPRCST